MRFNKKAIISKLKLFRLSFLVKLYLYICLTDIPKSTFRNKLKNCHLKNLKEARILF